MEQSEIYQKFAKISRIKRPEGYHTPNEWEGINQNLEISKRKDGIKQLKRKLLGLCGTESLKTLDEIIYALCSLGICNSPKEGIEFVSEIESIRNLSYMGPINNNYLKIEKVENSEKNKLYRVRCIKEEKGEGCED